MIPIFKILKPKLIKTIIDYVTKDNHLDLEVKIINTRIARLEKHSHARRKLICNKKGKSKCRLVE